jgi:hypothetical protein
MQSCPLLQVVQAFAIDATNTARDTLHINLDFSFESLCGFDELLLRYLPYYTEVAQHYTDVAQQVATGGAPGIIEGQFHFPAQMWGSYIGEVLRRKWGGEWVQVAPGAYPELILKGRQISPSAAVAQWFESCGAASLSTFVEEIDAA